jgi:hypothetical protein
MMKLVVGVEPVVVVPPVEPVHEPPPAARESLAGVPLWYPWNGVVAAVSDVVADEEPGHHALGE